MKKEKIIMLTMCRSIGRELAVKWNRLDIKCPTITSLCNHCGDEFINEVSSERPDYNQHGFCSDECWDHALGEVEDKRTASWHLMEHEINHDR